jgi:hypothetical protein
MDSETSKKRLLWYFAYGANMSTAVMKRRKIDPLESRRVRCDEYSLSFNVMGVPYSDPAMGGLRKREESRTDGKDKAEDISLASTPVHGVAYLLNEEDLWRIVAIEGCVSLFVCFSTEADGTLLLSGGIAYCVVKVRLTHLDTGEDFEASTLIGRHKIVETYIRAPSRRYLVSIESWSLGRHDNDH